MSLSSSSSTSSSSPFALNAKCSVRPEKREAFVAAILDDQVCTRRDEPGNLQFVVGEDTGSANTFYLHEEFVDESAFEEHTKSPHFARFDEFCRSEKPFSEGGEIDLSFFHPLREDKWSEKRKVANPTAFCLNVNLFPKPEVREAFFKAIDNNKKGTDTTEPLALQYTYGESTTVSDAFHFHEQYTGAEDGKEGFDAHTTMPHFGAWEEFAGTNPFTKPPEVYFFKSIEK
eukprot:CAMPEP_0198154474 /NCGR_PEP_ID=MMETSP1443-20131203/68615_1 /TAXON_ID=186043 /ORGANISM="Entomoneis sp., Strain CCMP2396" /LENGTH=229 /DNA_ID=CAMNT_0043821153 /DNA_START=107 /DNA_END=796 /DNA_ORIENTATION=-